MKQTAVQWFADQIDLLIDYVDEKTANAFLKVIEQAKEMEKQQIENAFRIGATTELTFGDNKAEQYYNTEYGGEQ